jgi:hypothetical protein
MNARALATREEGRHNRGTATVAFFTARYAEPNRLLLVTDNSTVGEYLHPQVLICALSYGFNRHDATACV